MVVAAGEGAAPPAPVAAVAASAAAAAEGTVSTDGGGGSGDGALMTTGLSAPVATIEPLTGLALIGGAGACRSAEATAMVVPVTLPAAAAAAAAEETSTVGVALGGGPTIRSRTLVGSPDCGWAQSAGTSSKRCSAMGPLAEFWGAAMWSRNASLP